MDTTPRAAAILAAASVILVTAATPALAGDGDVVRRGSCSGSADWKLKVGREDGRLEVEGEVDSNRAGQTWRWKMWHNGSVSATGTRTTRAPSGSFEVRRLMVNRPGADRITFTAYHPGSGQSCRGALAY